MRSPRLLEVLYSFNTGGSERLGARLANALQAKGYAVQVCALHTGQGPISQNLEQAGIATRGFSLEILPFWQKLFFPLRFFLYLKRNHIEVMHVHHVFVLRHCYRIARLAGVKRIVLTEHSIHEYVAFRSLRKAAVYYAPRVDCVTTIYRGMADYFLQRAAVPENRLAMIYNWVDTQHFKPDTGERIKRRVTLNIASNTVVFGWLGRMQPVKDVGTLLKAFFQLLSLTSQPAELLLIGDGVDKNTAMALAQRLNIRDQVRFLGEQQEIPQWLNAMDIFVSSSLNEGLPLVLLEAMSCGLPCIATDVGGVAELVTQETGYVVPPNNPSALASAMHCLADQASLRNELGTQARRMVEARFSQTEMIDGYRRALGLV